MLAMRDDGVVLLVVDMAGEWLSQVVWAPYMWWWVSRSVFLDERLRF